MKQLSSATACPVPFEMMAYFECDDFHTVEALVHEELGKLRVSTSREFFRAKRIDALEAISGAFDSLEIQELSSYAPWPLKEEEIQNGAY